MIPSTTRDTRHVPQMHGVQVRKPHIVMCAHVSLLCGRITDRIAVDV